MASPPSTCPLEGYQRQMHPAQEDPGPQMAGNRQSDLENYCRVFALPKAAHLGSRTWSPGLGELLV